MADRNAYFLGYRIKVDEDNFITYVYGSDPETGAVQIYLAPWKFPYWFAIPSNQIEEILLDEAKAYANGIHSSVKAQTIPNGGGGNAPVLMPSIYRAG